MAFDESLLEELDGFDESLLQPIEEPTPAAVPRSMEWEGPPIPPASAPAAPSPTAPQVQYGYMGIPYVAGAQEKPMINVPSGIAKSLLNVAMRQPAPNLSHLLWLLPEGTRKNVSEGLAEGASEMASGMTSPEATASLAATMAVPELMGPAWKIYGLAQVPQAVKSVLESKDAKERAKSGLNLAAALAMGLAPGAKKAKALEPEIAKEPVMGEIAKETPSVVEELKPAVPEEVKVDPVEGVKEMLAEPPKERLSETAWDLGRQVQNIDQVKELLRLKEKTVKDSMDEFAKRMEEISKLPAEEKIAAMESPEMAEIHRRSSMGTQIVNEALEKATGYNITKNKPGETFPVPMTPEEFAKLQAEIKSEPEVKAAPETAPKEEPVTPPESDNVHVQNAKRVADMASRTEFSRWSNEQPGGAMGAATTVGRNSPTREFVDYLKQQWDKAIAAQRDTTKSQTERLLNQNKAKFFREAHEAATGTGMAEPGSPFRRDNPDYKPPFPITETEKGPAYAKVEEQASSGVPTEQGKPAIGQAEGQTETGTALGSREGQEGRPAPQEVLLSREEQAKANYLKFLEKVAKRKFSEAKGQEILDDAADAGRTVQQISEEFFRDVYPNLSPEVKARLDRFFTSSAGVGIGDVVATKPGPGGTREQVIAKSWSHVFPEFIDATNVEDLQGTDRGLVAVMEFGNKSKGQSLQSPKQLGEPGLAGRVSMNVDPVATAKAAVKIITDFVSSAKPELKTMAASLQGKAVPRTSTAAPESGNALVRYASARIAAPAVARSMATDVLGPHHTDTAFSQKLGAVIMEDILRTIKDEAQRAGDPNASSVATVIGKSWSPFKTEADYKAALNDADIANAIERHKATVQQRAEEAHVKAGGELASVGKETGAFVNFKALFPEAEAEVFAQGGRGNLDNPLRRLTRFFRQRKGTAEKYELDYRTLAERMIQGNFEEMAKRQLYDQLIKDGLAVETEAGSPRPEIGGKPTVGFTIERRGIPAGENQAQTLIKKLWVRQDLAREFRQAEDLDGPVARAGLVTAANIINRIQLAGPTDAVWHTANMIGSIAGSQGGKTLLSDFARKLPGVNLADALARTTTSAIRVMRDDPNIQRQIAELAELGAMRAPHDANFMGRFIQFIDRAGRLVRDDMYQNLVRRGIVTASEAGRRDWVNQMGAYNPRLMGQFQRFFKEAGFSPFIVAGRNFNRMAMRRLFMQPGIEAANPKEALKLRAVEAFGTFATLVVVPSLINYALTGNPSGRPGTKFGAIDTGKNDKDGNAIVIDPAQWTGLRRGLRISGGQAVIEGMRRGQSGKQIARSVLRDQLGGILHPWTGPPVTAATVAATGYDPRSYKQSEDPSDPAQNLKAALEQLNPVVKAIITSHEKDTPIAPTSAKEAATAAGKAVGEIGKSFGGAVGVKAQKLATPKDQLTDLHQIWMRNNPDKKIRADYERRQKEQFVSDYKDLDTAMTKNDGPAVLRAINKLLESKTPKDLNERMSPFYKESPAHIEGTKKPLFQESLVTEGKFYRTLNDAQKKIYQQAQKDRVERYKRFVEYLREAIRQRQAPAPRGPIPQPYA